MPAKVHPTLEFEPFQVSWDGGSECYDVVIDTATLTQKFNAKQLYVIPDEQRGDDPISGKEMLSLDKVERWYQSELAGTFRVGQLTFCSRSETGGKVVVNGDTLEIYGDLVLADSRQRVYTLVKAEEGKANGNGYQTRFVSARIYPNTTPESRKATFYDYNQEGSKADESRSKYLAPRGYTQRVARNLVERNTNLTHENVNTVRNRVTSKDHRLAGFNTFAQAVEASWARKLESPEHVEQVSDYLVSFWDRLVEVLPELGIVSVVKRVELRKSSLVGHAVTIYGYLAVARALHDNGESLDRLKELNDPNWFGFDAAHWKEEGIVVPSRDRKTGEVTGYRVAMSFQTRSAMTRAMLAKMGLGESQKDDTRN